MTTRGTRRAALTISEFARASGLSHKALRLYDLSGLLPPAEIDPATGYRFYAADQLERARRISLLRQLDMPLAMVAEVLAGSDEEALARLERWWAEQVAAMDVRRGAMEYLCSNFIRGAGGVNTPSPRHQVRLRDVPETKIAAIRQEVDQAELVPTMIAACGQVREHLRAEGAATTCEEWWIYHGLVTPDSRAPVEVCVPFTGAAEPAGPIVIRIEPAHTEAHTTLTKDECGYPRILLAYDAVDEWVHRSGLPPVGPPREVYFAAADHIAGTDPFVHVARPVERSPASVERSPANVERSPESVERSPESVEGSPEGPAERSAE
jgi:DNA-binding transcriptional MerR regulator